MTGLSIPLMIIKLLCSQVYDSIVTVHLSNTLIAFTEQVLSFIDAIILMAKKSLKPLMCEDNKGL